MQQPDAIAPAFQDTHGNRVRERLQQHALPLLLIATWAGVGGMVAAELARADRSARFAYLLETQVCHTPAAPPPRPLTSLQAMESGKAQHR